MLRTFALALTVPLVSAAHGLHNPWIHGVSGCTKKECCAQIKTGLCKGNTCKTGNTVEECRGRIEDDIVCKNHPYLKTDKADGTVGRTYTACCKSMCSTYDRCNENDELNTNKFGYVRAKSKDDGDGWEANLVKGSRQDPVKVDAGTALGNEPRFYYNKYMDSRDAPATKTKRAYRDTAGVYKFTFQPTPATCPIPDVEYQAASAKTTCCASTCNNFRLITTKETLGGNPKYSSIRHGAALSIAFTCENPHAATNNHDGTTTARYTKEDLNKACAGVTCTLAECCKPQAAPECEWNAENVDAQCGQTVTGDTDNVRSNPTMCGSGGKVRISQTLNKVVGTCPDPAGFTPDNAHNTKNSFTRTKVGFKVYKDEDCCLKKCGVDCEGNQQDTGCSLKCGTTGVEQEKFVETTAQVLGKIPCTGVNVKVGEATVPCNNGYRDSQSCAQRYGVKAGTTARNKSPEKSCGRVTCCKTWLQAQCGTKEQEGKLFDTAFRNGLTANQGCCSQGYHASGVEQKVAGQNPSNEQCCVMDKSNKCFSQTKHASQSEVNTKTGVSAGVDMIDEVQCPAGWGRNQLPKDPTCEKDTQAGPNRMVNDAGAYINIYACCKPPVVAGNSLDANVVAETKATKTENTNNWCQGQAGDAFYGYNGRNGVLATTAATSTHVHNQLGSYESTPLRYVCPTTHSLKDYKPLKEVNNKCAEECVVRTDAWLDCIASPAQTVTTACGVSTTWYGTKKAGFTNIGGKDGTGTYGANCKHTEEPCKCQDKVDAMYKSCQGCPGAEFTVGQPNTPTPSSCPVGLSATDCPPVKSVWSGGKTGKTLFANTIVKGSLKKGAAVTTKLWGLDGGKGKALTALTDMIVDTGADHDTQGYGGKCKLYTIPTCPTYENEKGTRDTFQISQCPDPSTALSASTPTKVLAADACTAMPALATAMVVAVAAVVF